MEPDKVLLLHYILTRLKENPILSQENINKKGKKLKPREGFENLKKLADDFLKGDRKSVV